MQWIRAENDLTRNWCKFRPFFKTKNEKKISRSETNILSEDWRELEAENWLNFWHISSGNCWFFVVRGSSINKKLRVGYYFPLEEIETKTQRAETQTKKKPRFSQDLMLPWLTDGLNPLSTTPHPRGG